MFKKILIALVLVLSLVGLTSCDQASWDAWVESLNKKGDSNYPLLLYYPEMTVVYPASGMTNSEFTVSRTTRYFEEVTGYKVNYEQNIAGGEDFYQNALIQGTGYHMMKMESGAYFSLVGKKNFVNLRYALEKYGKNLYGENGKGGIIPEEAWAAVTDPETGAIYAIPEIGFSPMISNALVWNMDHLEAVGITTVPQTIDEVTDAFYKLQNHFGATDDTYHAFAMSGAQAYIGTLAAAWNLNENFYETEEGKISHVMYSDEYASYTKYLFDLVQDGVISTLWKTYAGADLVSNFADGKLGCAYLSYWNINDLVEIYAIKQGVSEEDARNALDWQFTVIGTGEYGTEDQLPEEAVRNSETGQYFVGDKLLEGKYLCYTSIGYYCCVPFYMKQYTCDVINWIDQRITDEAFEGYRLGDEGVHFNYVDSDHPNVIEVEISGETKYVELLPAYESEILPTSMYQTGVNPKVGTNLWVLSEVSYNAWSVLYKKEDKQLVGNAMALNPYLKGWSEIDIKSRSWVLTNEQNLLNAKNESTYNRVLNNMRNDWNTNYWTETVDSGVQYWHTHKDEWSLNK